jgi:hypothetical protein
MGRPQDPIPHPVPSSPIPVDGDWCVLIEENSGGGEYVRWQLSHVRKFRNRADALTDAAIMARRYEPKHPLRDRGRQIFRTGEDRWTVQVLGASGKTFHFTVTVARPEPL